LKIWSQVKSILKIILQVKEQLLKQSLVGPFFLKIFNEEAMCNVSEKDLVKSLTTINLAHNANPLVP